jgi:LacI family transcriptional regulator
VPADFEAFRDWFTTEKPDAILATHARFVLGWLQEMGVSVPESVGIIDLEAQPQKDFAGVHFDPGKIGALAVETLVGLMYRNETGVPADRHEILLTGEWRDGCSLSRRNI